MTDKRKITPAETGRPSPVLVIFLIVPLLGILVALLMIAAEQPAPAINEASAPSSQSLVSRPAPYFELATLEGETISLDDYAGRTLFLNFWQTTCAPCVRELPAFAEFAESQGEDGAAVLAVNFDETSAMVFSFFEENGITGVPVAMDADSSVRRTYGVVQIPVTYVIAPDGTVRFLQIGELTIDDMEEYAELVETTDPDV